MYRTVDSRAGFGAKCVGTHLRGRRLSHDHKYASMNHSLPVADIREGEGVVAPLIVSDSPNLM